MTAILVMSDDSEEYAALRQDNYEACQLFETLRDSGYEHGVIHQLYEQDLMDFKRMIQDPVERV